MGPLVLPLIGMGVGALGNMLGSDPETERVNRILAMMKNRESEIGKEYDEAGTNLQRRSASDIKKKRISANQKAAQTGLNPITANYSNEAGIYDALYSGMANLKIGKEQAINDLKNKEMELEANAPIERGPFEKFFTGALSGFNLGAGINSAAGIGMKTSLPGGTAGTSTTLGTGNLANIMQLYRQYPGLFNKEIPY